MTFENLVIFLLAILVLIELCRSSAASKQFKDGYKQGIKDGGDVMLKIMKSTIDTAKSVKDEK